MDQALTGFTNIQHLDPEIIVDLRYATTNNFTHQVIYDFTTAIVRTGTATNSPRQAPWLNNKVIGSKSGMLIGPSAPSAVYLKCILIQNLLPSLILISATKKASP